MKKSSTIGRRLQKLEILLLFVIVLTGFLSYYLGQFPEYRQVNNLSVSGMRFGNSFSEFNYIVRIYKNYQPIHASQVNFRMVQKGRVVSEVQASGFFEYYGATISSCPVIPETISEDRVCELIVSITENGRTQEVIFTVKEPALIGWRG